MKPRKHAEIIKAWADGHTIQYLHDDGEHEPWWVDITGNCVPWDIRDTYRIKPKSKKPVVRWKWAYNVEGDNGVWREYSLFLSEEEVKEYFKEVLHMKLEYTRTEFPE